MGKIFGSKKANAMKNQEAVWVKCQGCGTAVYEKDFQENLKICEKCGFQHKMNAFERLEMLVDKGSFQELFYNIHSCDPLDFGVDYREKLQADVEKTGLEDALLTGLANIASIPVAIGIMDFFFRGGSMGSVVGEKLTRLFEQAIKKECPAVVVTSSGGARMQEGILALMQMAKTSSLTVRMAANAIPYIVVLTDPTTGGVSASFASLGDIIIAESKAIIGFSGARVIEQTIRQKLPPGFQSSEFYLEHGFVDAVVDRKDLRNTLIKVLGYFNGGIKN